MKFQELGISIGPIFIAYYGLFIVIGIGAAAFAGWLQAKKYHLNMDEIILMGAVCGLTGLAGAKILYLAVSFRSIQWSRFLEPAYFNQLMQGGFVYYGGIIGAAAGLFLCRYGMKIQVGNYLEKVIPCLPILHGFGRIGCAIAGCCYGIPYDGPFSVTYRHSLFAPEGVSLFPVQAVEGCWEFAVAAFLLFYQNHFSGGHCVKWYILLYGTGRFFLEFFRYDDLERGMLFGLSLSQYISLLFLIGLLIFQFGIRKKGKIAG